MNVRAWLPAVLSEDTVLCNPHEARPDLPEVDEESLHDAPYATLTSRSHQAGNGVTSTSHHSVASSSTHKLSKEHVKRVQSAAALRDKPTTRPSSPKGRARSQSKSGGRIGTFITAAATTMTRSRSSSMSIALMATSSSTARPTSGRKRSNTETGVAKLSERPKQLESAPQPRSLHSTLREADYSDLAEQHGSLEMKRQSIIYELCETEEAFVDSIKSIIKMFMQPLRTPLGQWISGIPSPISRLFDWLDDIVHLHGQICSALRCAQTGQRPVVWRVADAILPFVGRLEVHQPYLARFEDVTTIINQLTNDTNSDFGEFVRMQQSLPECGSLPLTSFLLKPVQRLMKYPLFFKVRCFYNTPNA